MKDSRRSFLKLTGMVGMGMVTNPLLKAGPVDPSGDPASDITPYSSSGDSDEGLNLIGPYGPWASGLHKGQLPLHSFRRTEWTDLDKWRIMATEKLKERLGIPGLGPVPAVKIHKQYEYDGLHIEELSWQLPYGRATEAILLKPIDAKGPLPGILAFHDHGGNKYFGKRKITKTSDQQHELMVSHQEHYYEGMAWANEIAKRGYVVMVNDAFPFASRRVMLKDVPERQRQGLDDADPENPSQIEAYNKWAANHEHIMAKSLFSAGTTWPGVFLAEDQVALGILCAREDVDAERIGCGGLSGGGMRTVFMGGLDPRIKCAVCVGFMTTWDDFILHKSFTHTWMTYVPISPKELDFPEILGLRAPLPTMVLNDIDDSLYTMTEMKKADEILKAVFAKANASDKYQCNYHPGPHKFDRKMQSEAFEWFDKWLK